jgi:meso-butanediol dehydrogenase/(S,S)-butanediol dehydrogenase/diacetyl reductase
MKNVLITGACSGMGLSATKLFLERGWGVVMTDLSQEKGIEIKNQLKDKYENVWFKSCNVAKSLEVKDLHDFVVENNIRIDSIINNAGIFTAGKLHEVDEDKWDLIFDVDVKSILLTGKYFIPDMIKNGGGTIVNTASVSGMQGDYDMAAYNAAKGAVVNLVRSMALDYGKYNIRVNNVCPSACATPMFLSNPEDVIEMFNQANPLKRICTPDEVAKAMYFLASDESTSCNGMNLTVSGGLEVHTGQPVQDEH